MAEYENEHEYDARRTDEDDSRWSANESSRDDDDSRDDAWEAPFHVPRD